MSNLVEVANSENGSGIRLWMLNDKYEDFLNKEGVFYCAFVNEAIIHTGYKDAVDERYLLILMYEEDKMDENGSIEGEVIARFPALSWTGIRVLD
jgi:hypothetical protein